MIPKSGWGQLSILLHLSNYYFPPRSLPFTTFQAGHQVFTKPAQTPQTLVTETEDFYSSYSNSWDYRLPGATERDS